MSSSVYEIITKRIIKSMSEGKIPWLRTWRVRNPGNVISGKSYRGINAFLLWEAASDYESRWFLTARQCFRLGGAVRESELSKGHIVTFWKQDSPALSDDAADDDVSPASARRVLRYYMVYNIRQCDGLDLPPRYVDDRSADLEPLPVPQKVFSDYADREDIRLREGSPCYSPSKDYIMMPPLADFSSQEAFYSTAYHEAIHSTGHLKRLARFKPDQPLRFGNEVYSREELVAEIGAAFLCARTGIQRELTYQNSIAYLQSWIAVLNNDPRMIIFAAAAAQKAADYILPELND